MAYLTYADINSEHFHYLLYHAARWPTGMSEVNLILWGGVVLSGMRAVHWCLSFIPRLIGAAILQAL
jgi:hypothetical protein